MDIELFYILAIKTNAATHIHVGVFVCTYIYIYLG